MKKTVLTGLALLLVLELAGCSGGAAKKTADSGDMSSENSLALVENNKTDDILSKLLINSGKFIRLQDIVEYGGQVYATKNLSPCIPGCNPVPGYGEFAIIGDVIIYEDKEGFESPSELGRMDLQGNNRILIADDVSKGSVRIAGDRIVYLTRNFDWETTGVFWYDLKTSKITRLLNEQDCKEFDSVVSFDDDFVYYKTDWNSDVSRVRWDGTKAEVLQGIKMPENLYKVEGEYYYCLSSDWDNSTAEISRYAINGGKPEGKYTISAKDIKHIVDGWAYFGNKTGIHKINLNDGTIIKLADLPRSKK